MKKHVWIYLFLLMSLSAAMSMERFEYHKQYAGSVFSGGKEKIAADDPEMLRMLILKNVTTKVDLFGSYARVRIFYTFTNKHKKQPLGFRLSYPKIDMNLGKENMIRDAANAVLNTEYEDKVIFGNYNDFTVTIDGVPEEYVNETDIEFETNIPFRIGDESLVRNEDGSYTDIEVSSYLYRYGWYHVALRLEPSSSSTVVISYSVPLYQNTVTIKANDDMNFEDPALTYDYYDLPDGKRLLSDKIFSFYNYVPYDSDVKAQKRVYEFYPRLIDDKFINVFPMKSKTTKKGILYVYKGDRFGEIDNIYVKMSEYNNPANVPSYYFESAPERVQTAGRQVYVFDAQSKDLVLRYNRKNKRSVSSLLPKRDDIGISEISAVVGKPLSGQQTKSRSMTFEVQFAQNEDFSDASVSTAEVTLPVYDELNPKKIILYKGDTVHAKYIRIKADGGKSGEPAPVFDSIQILQ